MILFVNIIWFVFGGFFVGLFYLLGVIILFLFLLFLLLMIGYSFWLFGWWLVFKQVVNVYKQVNGQEFDLDDFEIVGGVVKFFVNVVWFLMFGWMLVIFYLLWGLMNLIVCLLIIIILICLFNVMVYFKLVFVVLILFGVKIVLIVLVEEIDLEYVKVKFQGV